MHKPLKIVDSMGKCCLFLIILWPIGILGQLPKKSPREVVVDRYIQAHHSSAKKACIEFKKLEKEKIFPLKKLTRLRRIEACGDKVQWSAIEKEIKEPWLKNLVIKIQYQNLMNQWKYITAYRLFKKTTGNIRA